MYTFIFSLTKSLVLVTVYSPTSADVASVFSQKHLVGLSASYSYQFKVSVHVPSHSLLGVDGLDIEKTVVPHVSPSK